MLTSNSQESVLKQRFEKYRAKLTRSELSVVEYLLSMPVGEMIFLNAEDIASRSGTSDATVIRAARRLGFTGLPELKRLCSRPIAKTQPPTQRLSQRFRATGNDLAVIKKHVFETAHEIVNSTEEKLEVDALAHAIQLLENADTVWCMGMGRSEVEAKHCSIALSRIGLRTRVCGEAGFSLANTLIDLRSGDVIVLFHAARETNEFKLILDQFTALGCPVILVCGVQLRDLYQDKVSAVLCCVGSATGLASWTVGAIVVSETIAYGIAAKNQQRALETKKKLTELRRRLG